MSSTRITKRLCVAVASAWYDEIGRGKEEAEANAVVSKQFGITPKRVLHDVIGVSKAAMNRKPYPVEEFGQ